MWGERREQGRKRGIDCAKGGDLRIVSLKTPWKAATRCYPKGEMKPKAGRKDAGGEIEDPPRGGTLHVQKETNR